MVEVKYSVGLLWTLACVEDALLWDDLVNQVREYPVPIVMEELLQKLILVVVVIEFDDESVDLLDLVKHIQMLLCLDGVQDALCVLAQLRQFFWDDAMLARAGTGLRSTHDEVDDLGLRELDAWQAETHLLVHLLLRLPVARRAAVLVLWVVAGYL